MTRNSTRGSTAAANEVHVLDFELDDDADCCSLTVLVKDFRFHITADVNDFLSPTIDQEEVEKTEDDQEDDVNSSSSEAARLGEEFRGLIAALRKEQEEAEYQGNSGKEEEKEEKDEPNPEAVGREVAKKNRKKSEQQDSKTNGESQTSTPPPDNDSGVDMSDPSETTGEKNNNSTKKKEESQEAGAAVVDSASTFSPPLSQDDAQQQQQQKMKSDPETQLRDLLLQPFTAIFSNLEPIPETQEGQQVVYQSLQEWYSGPTYFYRVYIDPESWKVKEKQVDASTELDRKIVKMAPRISVAKDVQRLDIPWFEAGEIEVIGAGEHCGLYAPTEVRIRSRGETDDEDEEVYFFKRVDPLQPAPTHREIRMLRDIEKKGLHEKMKCPVIKGLVRWYGTAKAGTSSQMMGFLQTNIPDGTPLTRMLDSDVVEEKRARWAKEVERCVEVLHAAGMVWGDAKADNFLVDRHGKLWIIDFGGSYTEGWVDEELSETVEGDDMGVDKIVGALRDPEGMTYDPEEGILFEAEEDKEDEEETKKEASRGKKREREQDVVVEDGDNKRPKA